MQGLNHVHREIQQQRHALPPPRPVETRPEQGWHQNAEEDRRLQHRPAFKIRRRQAGLHPETQGFFQGRETHHRFPKAVCGRTESAKEESDCHVRARDKSLRRPSKESRPHHPRRPLPRTRARHTLRDHQSTRKDCPSTLPVCCASCCSAGFSRPPRRSQRFGRLRIISRPRRTLRQTRSASTTCSISSPRTRNSSSSA